MAERKSTSPNGSRLVLLLALSYAVSFVDRALVAVAGAPIKHDFALTDTQFGALHGLAFVALYAFCGIPFGWLADRGARRGILAGGLVFWSVMTALCGLAGSFPVFFAARIGVGLGEACLVPVAMSLMGSVVRREDMAPAVAVFLMGAALGNAAALIGGGALLEQLAALGSAPFAALGVHAPWRALFLVASLPGFVIAAVVMAFAEPPRRPDRAGAALAGGLGSALAHLRSHRRAYGFLTAATACSVTLSQAQAAWIPLLYVRRFGLTPAHSAMSVGFLFLATAPLGQWIGGRVIRQMQARGVAAPPHRLLAATALLSLPVAVVFCTSAHLGTSRLAYAAFNLLVFAATPAGLTGWQLLTPDRARGRLIALLTSIVTIVGVGAGPAVVGLLTDRVFADDAALNLSLLAVIAAAAVACASCALIGQRSYARALARVAVDDPAVVPLPAISLRVSG